MYCEALPLVGLHELNIMSTCLSTDCTSGSTASSLIRPANLMVTPAATSPEPLCSLKPPADTAATENVLASHGEEKLPMTNSPSEMDMDQKTEPETETDTETEEEKARRLLYCSLCKVAVNSASQLDAHNTGKKQRHKYKDLIFCMSYIYFSHVESDLGFKKYNYCQYGRIFLKVCSCEKCLGSYIKNTSRSRF